MATLIEMTAEVVASHASATPMSTEELVSTIQRVFSTLKQMESGDSCEAIAGDELKPAIPARQSIKKSEVICLICGKGGMKALSRHLTQVHQVKPNAYRKQFGIPAGQPLAAKDFTAKRKELAAGMNLAANLEKARAVRKAKIEARNSEQTKTRGKK